MKSFNRELDYIKINKKINNIDFKSILRFEAYLEDIYNYNIKKEKKSISKQSEWFLESFDYLYLIFDIQRQHFDKKFKLRRTKELDLIKKSIPFNIIEVSTVIEVGIGYGRFIQKLLNEFPHISIKGIDCSSILLNEAKKNLSKYKKQIEFYLYDMRYLDSLNFFYTADIVLFIFTTFGYFNHKTNEKVLKSAYNLLKPGGILLIEQYNPQKFLESPFSIKKYEKNYNKKKILLLKTSNFMRSSKYYTRYWGKYFYFWIENEKSNKFLLPMKYHNYNIILYNEMWFLNCIKSFGKPQPIIEFDWVYDSYEDNNRNASLMIIKIRKPL